MWCVVQYWSTLFMLSLIYHVNSTHCIPLALDQLEVQHKKYYYATNSYQKFNVHDVLFPCYIYVRGMVVSSTVPSGTGFCRVWYINSDMIALADWWCCCLVLRNPLRFRNKQMTDSMKATRQQLPINTLITMPAIALPGRPSGSNSVNAA